MMLRRSFALSFAATFVGCNFQPVDAEYKVIGALPCEEVADCLDECHSTAQCVDGVCVRTADKDADADGGIDANCPGGNDCDDDPTKCGKHCYWGNAAADICDGKDQNCDGVVDDDPEFIWYKDLDGDGHGDPSDYQFACADPDGTEALWVNTLGPKECEFDDDCLDACHSTGTCLGGYCQRTADKDDDGDDAVDALCPGGTDCDDNPDTCGNGCYPGNTASDICDGYDQDCDGAKDENPTAIWYRDADRDGYVDPGVVVQACEDPDGTESGWVGFLTEADCDDDPQACGNHCKPSKIESLNMGNCADGWDNNCNGLVDDDLACLGVNTAPEPAFTITPMLAEMDEEVTFDATLTRDAEQSVLELYFEWDFDGDGIADEWGRKVTRVFDTLRTHTVVLRVYDPEDAYGMLARSFVVADAGSRMVVNNEDALAVALGNAAGASILIEPGTVIPLSTELALMSGPTTLVGGDGSLLLGPSSPDTSCLVVEGSDNTIIGVHVADCTNDGFEVYGMNNQFIDCSVTRALDDAFNLQAGPNIVGPGNWVHDVLDDAVQVSGADSSIIGNRFEHLGSSGVQVGDGDVTLDTAPGTEIIRNVIIAAGGDAIKVDWDADGTIIWHNTLHANAGSAVYFEGNTDISGHQVKNNIMSWNEAGITGIMLGTQPGAETTPNAYFSNKEVDCDICDTGGTFCIQCSSGTEMLDPAYVDPYGFDLRLTEGSECVDSFMITELGVDMTPNLPNLFLGTAPDFGALEFGY